MKKAVLPDGRNSRAEEQKTCLGHSLLAFLMQVYQDNHLLHSSGAVRKDYFIFLICTRKKTKGFWWELGKTWEGLWNNLQRASSYVIKNLPPGRLKPQWALSNTSIGDFSWTVWWRYVITDWINFSWLHLHANQAILVLSKELYCSSVVLGTMSAPWTT